MARFLTFGKKQSILHVNIIPLSPFNFSNELILYASLPFYTQFLLRSWWILVDFTYECTSTFIKTKCFLYVVLRHHASIT